MFVLSVLPFALLLTTVHSFTIPSNLLKIYNDHKAGICSKKLASGFSPGDPDDNSFAYCGDITNAVYLHSTGNGGQYADMDIDCDGANLGAGKCSNDPTGQSQTAFKDTIAEYDAGISDLDANVHPYVVFGNEGAIPNYDPQKDGVEPLSVMAIVCGNQLHYGVWGDTNGATTVGEASISLADLCFPNEDLNGDKGHVENDVLYIAFKGSAAVPEKNARWNASNAAQFEASIKTLGDRLVAGLK